MFNIFQNDKCDDIISGMMKCLKQVIKDKKNLKIDDYEHGIKMLRLYCDWLEKDLELMKLDENQDSISKLWVD